MLRKIVTDVFEIVAIVLFAAAAGFAAAQCWSYAAGTAASGVTLLVASVVLVLIA